MFHAFACEENLEFLFLRTFQVYGEGEAEGRFWPYLLKTESPGQDLPMSEGLQIRDFINVTDVAAAFVRAISRTDLTAGSPKIENLGTGSPQTLANFAKKEWKRLGATGTLLTGALPMRKNEVMRYVPQQ